VQDYLDHQQLAPFFEMSERYGKLYQKMVDILEKLDPQELELRSERRATVDELPPGTLASLWVDVEATINGTDGLNPPPSIEEAIARHIGAVEAWLDGLGAGTSTKTEDDVRIEGLDAN
jgi:hypothetical protein